MQISAVTRQICTKQSSKERQRNFQSNGASGVQILWLNHFWVSRLVKCVMTSLVPLHPSMLPFDFVQFGLFSIAMLVLPLPNLPLHKPPFIAKGQTFKPSFPLLSRQTADPRLTVYRRRHPGAPNPGIGPPWPSRSGPSGSRYLTSDLPSRRGPGRPKLPNPRYRTPNVWF